MSDPQALLDTLRDVIEPPAPAGTSLWLLAANACLLMLIVMLSVVLFRRRKNQWRMMALHSVHAARQEVPDRALLLLAKLLRQLMLHRQHDVIQLSGERWLVLLDQEFQTRWFSHEQGQVFGESLYERRSYSTEQRDHWCNTLEFLIHKLPHPTPQSGA